MKRFLFALAAIAPFGMGGCNKPTEEDCRQAIGNIEQIRGTEAAQRNADNEGEVRRCRGSSTKESVACAIKAKSPEDLKACAFRGPKGKPTPDPSAPSPTPAPSAPSPTPAPGAPTPSAPTPSTPTPNAPTTPTPSAPTPSAPTPSAPTPGSPTPTPSAPTPSAPAPSTPSPTPAPSAPSK